MSAAKRSSKKSARRNYKEQADALFAKAIRDIGYCEECGISGPGAVLQCAHIVSRSYSAIRTNFLNAVCLCRACHFYYTPRPIEWEEWALRRLGNETYLQLRIAAVADYPIKFDWAAEVERLKTAVPDMRAEPLRLRRTSKTHYEGN